ncbi:MAG: MFS transporter [Candidatus Omnitrophota bacterium]
MHPRQLRLCKEKPQEKLINNLPNKKNSKLFWIFALSSSVYFTQGIEGLPSQSLFYYLKETLNFSPEKIMVLTSIITFAWLIKPIIGYLIDNFFTKRIWIFLAALLSIITALILGFAILSIFLLIGLLLFNSTNAAFRDVSVDGIMCVEGKKYGITGKIQSVQWMSISISGLITGIGGGYIAQRWGYQAAFLCLIPFYLLVIINNCFYKEQKLTNNIGFKKPSLIPELKKLFLDKRLLLVSLFLYKFSPSFGTPLFFIQRDEFRWSKMWIGVLGTMGTVFEISGAILYYKFSQRINIKKWLYGSVFLGAVVTLSYLYYTPTTAVVYNVLYSLIGMFIFIMVMDLWLEIPLRAWRQPHLPFFVA